MRRNFKGCLKFLMLTILTVGTTVVVFRLIRQPIYRLGYNPEDDFVAENRRVYV